MVRAVVFVMDGLDISRYESAEAAAAEVEGFDAADLDYIGADGLVYRATVEGPKWGPVTLHPTPENRLDQLVERLRLLAESRAMALPPDLPDDPERIWAYIEDSQQRRSGWWRSWFWRRSTHP